ncbi:MAG: alpha/beta fold hydrolase [Ideonella sp.]
MIKQQSATPSRATDAPMPSPSWSLLGTEPVRAAIEYFSFQLQSTQQLPRGDGHPVVIFPGLGADHHSIAPLKSFCIRHGYDAYDWGRGFNTGPHGDGAAWLESLAQDVRRIVQKNGRPMSLIGWSLGGIYARELAKILDGEVRQVITLGSPFAGDHEHTNVAWIYRLLNRRRAIIDDSLQSRLAMPPDVPTTSIYTRNDGIVAWQACLHRETAGAVEDIEVDGSHCGMCWNRDVHAIVADRLAQPEGSWQPYSALHDAAAGRVAKAVN